MVNKTITRRLKDHTGSEAEYERLWDEKVDLIHKKRELEEEYKTCKQ